VETNEQRELYNGFGNALGLAVELAGTPVLFGFAGWWLDHRLGTGHLLVIVLSLFALIGLAVRSYFTYSHQMEEHEAKGPWRRT